MNDNGAIGNAREGVRGKRIIYRRVRARDN